MQASGFVLLILQLSLERSFRATMQRRAGTAVKLI